MKQSNKAGSNSLGWQWHTPLILALLLFHACIAAATTASTSAEQELLEPERAFLLSARFKDAKTAEFLYKIADGYYMYRTRFKIVGEPATSAKIGKAVFTKGEMKDDATFGRVEIFRNSMRILIPVSRLGKDFRVGDEKLLRLKVTSQGCADAGVCYPPLHQTLTLKVGSGDLKYPNSPFGVASDLHPAQSVSETGKPPLSEMLKKPR
ncbi:MAG: protein-disulfide reductase DsbD N-terminal domain-containing protein [Betaproteobacteria bacterium]